MEKAPWWGQVGVGPKDQIEGDWRPDGQGGGSVMGRGRGGSFSWGHGVSNDLGVQMEIPGTCPTEQGGGCICPSTL